MGVIFYGDDMTSEQASAIVREFYPDASADDVGYLLWNETGWPCFWRDRDIAKCIREDIGRFKETGVSSWELIEQAMKEGQGDVV